MSYKRLILTLIILLGFAAAAIPQTWGAFYGYVRYYNCDCQQTVHHVWIRKAGQPGDYHNVRCSGFPGYSTGQYTYTAGWYYISVVDLDGTGCDKGNVQYVYYNGIGGMQVDLAVYGPTGNPDSPGGE